MLLGRQKAKSEDPKLIFRVAWSRRNISVTDRQTTYGDNRGAGPPEAFQDWYGENHPISRLDDGGTEGPERGAGGAKRRSAEGGEVWGGAP